MNPFFGEKRNRRWSFSINSGVKRKSLIEYNKLYIYTFSYILLFSILSLQYIIQHAVSYIALYSPTSQNVQREGSTLAQPNQKNRCFRQKGPGFSQCRCHGLHGLPNLYTEKGFTIRTRTKKTVSHTPSKRSSPKKHAWMVCRQIAVVNSSDFSGMVFSNLQIFVFEFRTGSHIGVFFDDDLSQQLYLFRHGVPFFRLLFFQKGFS